MYSFEKSADEEMIDLIDCAELRKKMEIICKIKGEKMEMKLKRIIKDDIKFNNLLSELNMNSQDFFFIAAKTFPNIFNHRLIKYIREKYLFKKNE